MHLQPEAIHFHQSVGSGILFRRYVINCVGLLFAIGISYTPLLSQAGQLAPGIQAPLPFIPEPCCNTLQEIINPVSETVIQTMTDGEAIYTLTQVDINDADQQYEYGALTKTDLNGNVKWRARADRRHKVTSFTRDNDGNFLVTGGYYDRSFVQTITAPDDEQNPVDTAIQVQEKHSGMQSKSVANYSALLMKLNAAGERVWIRIYEKSDFNGVNINADGNPYFYALEAQYREGSGTVVGSRLYSMLNIYELVSGTTVRAVHRLTPERDVDGPFEISGNLLVVESFARPSDNWLIAANYEFIFSLKNRGALTLYDRDGVSAQGHLMPEGHRIDGVKPLNDRIIAVAATKEPVDEKTPSQAKLFLIQDSQTIIKTITWSPNQIAQWTDIDVRKDGSDYDLVLSGIMTNKQAVVQTVRISGSSYDIAVGQAGMVKRHTNNHVSSSALQISPDGETIAYADGRTSARGATENTMIGNINFSLTEKCTSNFTPTTNTSNVRLSLDPYSITVTDAVDNSYADESGSFVTVAIRNNCNYEIVDACTEPYPTQTSRLIQLARPAGCDDGQAVNVVVTDALGNAVLPVQPFAGGIPIKINLSGVRQGTYFIRISNTDDELLHVASVRVV